MFQSDSEVFGMNPSLRPQPAGKASPSSDLPRFEKKRHLTIVELPADGIVKPGDVDRVCSVIEQQIELSPERCDFLLSFGQVQYMSSLFIGRLMGFYKRLAQKRAKLMLCDMHQQLVNVIRLARLERQMPIYLSRAQAITGRTPAVTGIITATALAGLAGAGALIELLVSGSKTGPSIVGWIALICLLANLPLPVLAWVFRRKISSYRPAAQWGCAAFASGLLIIMLLLLL
jgi:anti-anti-sigma factor